MSKLQRLHQEQGQSPWLDNLTRPMLHQGTLARTIDTDTEGAAEVVDRLAGLGIDLHTVGRTLENQGVASFHQSFARTLQALEDKAGRPARASAGGTGRR
jgi:hypothetical protein